LIRPPAGRDAGRAQHSGVVHVAFANRSAPSDSVRLGACVRSGLAHTPPPALLQGATEGLTCL
jgi:hypothetical protein